MRDFETIETALTAAETGHLVLSTLHTVDATETINRIISVFPPHQQKQVRLPARARAAGGHLAAPRPARRRQGPRARRSRSWLRPPASATASSNEEKTTLIPRAPSPQGTTEYGMQTFDQSLFDLCQKGLISREEAARGAPILMSSA